MAPEVTEKECCGFGLGSHVLDSGPALVSSVQPLGQALRPWMGLEVTSGAACAWEGNDLGKNKMARCSSSCL